VIAGDGVAGRIAWGGGGVPGMVQRWAHAAGSNRAAPLSVAKAGVIAWPAGDLQPVPLRAFAEDSLVGARPGARVHGADTQSGVARI
jgi:hypothetical protein